MRSILLRVVLSFCIICKALLILLGIIVDGVMGSDTATSSGKHFLTSITGVILCWFFAHILQVFIN